MYGHLGPIIAAERLQKTVADLKAQGVTAVMAYSEGVFEDVNKAILAGLASGQYQTADEVLEAYARRYFGVDADTARLWAAWLKAWGKPFDVDTRQSAATLETLLKKTPKGGWRLRQWELKQQLFAIHRQIGPGTSGRPSGWRPSSGSGPSRNRSSGASGDWLPSVTSSADATRLCPGTRVGRSSRRHSPGNRKGPIAEMVIRRTLATWIDYEREYGFARSGGSRRRSPPRT